MKKNNLGAMAIFALIGGVIWMIWKQHKEESEAEETGETKTPELASSLTGSGGGSVVIPPITFDTGDDEPQNGIAEYVRKPVQATASAIPRTIRPSRGVIATTGAPTNTTRPGATRSIQI